jgi:hypothetical protein
MHGNRCMIENTAQIQPELWHSANHAIDTQPVLPLETAMPRKPAQSIPLSGPALVKEVCRRIRLARSAWDAHRNAACRRERERALELYATLDEPGKEQVPQVLRVWLRYRSEKYFGDQRTPPGSPRK